MRSPLWFYRELRVLGFKWAWFELKRRYRLWRKYGNRKIAEFYVEIGPYSARTVYTGRWLLMRKVADQPIEYRRVR